MPASNLKQNRSSALSSNKNASSTHNKVTGYDRSRSNGKASVISSKRPGQKSEGSGSSGGLAESLSGAPAGLTPTLERGATVTMDTGLRNTALHTQDRYMEVMSFVKTVNGQMRDI